MNNEISNDIAIQCMTDYAHAMSDIRRFIETKWRNIADLPSLEATLIHGPEIKNEADVLISAIDRVVDHYSDEKNKEKELSRALAAAQLENQIYRDQIDALQASADERFDAMHEMLVGYILWKCNVPSVVFDPEEMQLRFPAMEVGKTLVKNNIKYYLINKDDL